MADQGENDLPEVLPGVGPVHGGRLLQIRWNPLQRGHVDNHQIPHRPPGCHNDDGQEGKPRVPDPGVVQKAPAPVVGHVVEHLGKYKHPHIPADDHADHIGHIEDGTVEALGPAAAFNGHRQGQGNYIGNEDHHDDIPEGKAHGVPEVGIGQDFPEIGQAHKVIGFLQPVPVGQRIKDTGQGGVQLEQNIDDQRGGTKQEQTQILLSGVFHGAGPPWKEKEGQVNHLPPAGSITSARWQPGTRHPDAG